MVLALSAAVACGIVLPHAVRTHGADPATVAALWLVSLSLRAVAGLFLAVTVLLFLPASGAFGALTHWCWHAVLPLATTHLGLGGHAVGGLVTVVPALLLGASLASILFGLARAAQAVRRLLAREGLGRGPEGAIIVAGSEVVLAAAGFARPKLVVSAGALVRLDEAELSAALAHERGHIIRRHRWLLAYAEICRGLGRVVPGGRAAQLGLAFQLERDADRWATRRHDPVALASAICKSGLSLARSPVASSMLSGQTGAVHRIDELLDRTPSRRRARTWTLRVAAATGVALLLGVTSLTPSTIAAGHAKRDAAGVADHCQA